MRLPYKILAIETAVPTMYGLFSLFRDHYDLSEFLISFSLVAFVFVILDILGIIIFAIMDKDKFKGWILGMAMSLPVLLITGFLAISNVSFGR